MKLLRPCSCERTKDFLKSHINNKIIKTVKIVIIIIIIIIIITIPIIEIIITIKPYDPPYNLLNSLTMFTLIRNIF